MSAYAVSARGLAGRKVPQGVLTPMGDLLFSASEPGAWYDPSDMSTLFQDSAGTVPVTAVEQPVGLMLDKSKGLILGPQLVENGDFSNGTTGWSAYHAVISAVNGTLKVDDSSNLGANSSAVQQLNLVAGRTYLLTFDVVSVSGAWSVGFATTDSSVGITFPSAMLSKNTTGPQRFVFTYDGTRNFLFMDVDGSGIVFYDNISVKELPGNHATQATTTKRPVLSRRYNLLTKTENVSDAAWNANLFGNWTINSARSAAAAPSPRGDFTATTISFTSPQSAVCVGQRAAVSPGIYRVSLWLRLTPGVSSPGSAFINIGVANGNANAWVAPYSNIQNIGPQLDESWKMFTIDHTVPPSGVNQIELLINKGGTAGTCSVDVWGGSLTLATDAHLPYQRINTASDYDADPAKYPAYLRFDGVDDVLQTGNIDFTGTDKMTVWGGVTKLSDAATGVVCELSTSVINSGTFNILAPYGASASYGFESTGTTSGFSTTKATTFAQPISNVLSCSYNIASSVAATQRVVRVNGAAPTRTDTSTPTTGSFGNYPLYIGARAGTTSFFNGRLHGLIVRGTQSNLSQIEAAERYIKQKMRLP